MVNDDILVESNTLCASFINDYTETIGGEELSSSAACGTQQPVKIKKIELPKTPVKSCNRIDSNISKSMTPSIQLFNCSSFSEPDHESAHLDRKCDCCAITSIEDEELICLCPKTGENSGQISRGGIRIKANALSSHSPRWCAVVMRIAPVLVMTLLCVTLWASVRLSLPITTEVHHESYEPLKLRITSGIKKVPVRSSKSLPSLPDFTIPFQLNIDVQTERIMDIYCRGSLLHTVQMVGVYADSKHFVDMPIKANSSVFDVLVDFQRRQLSMTEYRPHKTISHEVALREFLDDHFDPPGTDLTPVTPFDYQEHRMPDMISHIQDPELRDWAFSLHQLWRHLGRLPNPRITSSYLHAKALQDPLLERSQNVLIVPGGRFRESYYWDSYWIVQGLLVSDMKGTARGVVNNLLEYVAEFGFVPNGGRVYYLTRSQPPMLSDMVKLVARIGGNTSLEEYDASYLTSALPILEHEYKFWMQQGPGGHAIQIERTDPTDPTRTITHVLNRYISNANHPRPESYREDVTIAEDVSGQTLKCLHGDARECEASKDRYYNEVIAAAESGWDFSSRWLRNGTDMSTIYTSNVVPVDLNSILYRMERNMMMFHAYLGHNQRAQYYKQAAHARRHAMDAILWSHEHQIWKDYLLDTNEHSQIVSISDYSPLWAKAFDPTDSKRLVQIIESLKQSELIQKGGLLTTTTFTGQQWDAPNAWPPEQDIVIEGLLAINLTEAHNLAQILTTTWVQTSLEAWRSTGLMFEKYNATEMGGMGVGGEYFPQFGFGWTNGVILKFLTIHQNLLLV